MPGTVLGTGECAGNKKDRSVQSQTRSAPRLRQGLSPGCQADREDSLPAQTWGGSQGRLQEDMVFKVRPA